jgi:hypothetical protein
VIFEPEDFIARLAALVPKPRAHLTACSHRRAPTGHRLCPAPSFTLGGAMREYDVLLINKIILTVIAFVVLYTLWFLAQRKRSKAGSTGS